MKSAEPSTTTDDSVEKTFSAMIGSPECITPSAFDTKRRVATQTNAIFTLVSTMVGGGVLSLPYAIAKSGLLVGLLILALSAIASDYSFDILVSAARRTGAMTYEQIGLFSFGKKASYLMLALILGLTWLASMAYIVLMGDLFVPVVCFIGSLSDDQCGSDILRKIVELSCLCCMLPFCFMRQLKALRYNSIISITSVVVLAGVVTAQTIQILDDHSHKIWYVDSHDNSNPMWISGRVHLWPHSLEETIYVFPIFGVSFLCHFNIPQVHSEIKRPSRSRVRRVLHLTTLVCLTLYSIVGIMGYYYSYEHTCGNILLNYDHKNIAVTIGRFGLGLTICFTYPLLILPARSSLHNLLNSFLSIPGMNRDEESQMTSVKQAIIDKFSPKPDRQPLLREQQLVKTPDSQRKKQPSEDSNFQYYGSDDESGTKRKHPNRVASMPALTDNNAQIQAQQQSTDADMAHNASLSQAAAHNASLSQEYAQFSLQQSLAERPSVNVVQPNRVREESPVVPPPIDTQRSQKPRLFVSRSISSLDSPLHTPDDAHVVVHDPSELDAMSGYAHRFQNLDAAQNYEPSTLFLIIETIVLIVVSVIVAFITKSVIVLWTLMGSTVSMLIAFTLPSLFFLRIRRHKKWRLRNIYALILVIISVLAIGFCTWQALINLDATPCPDS